MKFLIVVGGATASGKTSLAIQLAQHFNTSIISADSRQFFKEMTIGTAKPTAEELAEAPHYFINNLSIQTEYSVGKYEREAIEVLEKLFQEKDVVIMVGGSGLYIKAVCEGLDYFPAVPDYIRQDLITLFENEGIEPLQKELAAVDPTYFKTVDQQNPQRLIRALEIYRTTGQTFSSFRKATKVERPFQSIKLALDWDREVLYNRINQRVDQMLDLGLEEEARQFYSQKALNSLQTVGYQEWFDCFDGKIDQAEAIRLIKRNTRRYAKRQLTWLRREGDFHYVQPEKIEEVISYLEVQLSNDKFML